MDTMICIQFICIALPLLLAMGLLEKKSRLVLGFVVLGMGVCVLVSWVNGIMRSASGESLFFVTTTLTPISEELSKALPVIFYAFVLSDKREQLITISMGLGIGFAILENSSILVSNFYSVSIIWAISRVFGASLMHGICTSAVGIGASYVHKKKKLFYCGTFALLTTAIIYHSIYNALVQSNYQWVGLLLPIVTYLPIVIIIRRKKAQKEK